MSIKDVQLQNAEMEMDEKKSGTTIFHDDDNNVVQSKELKKKILRFQSKKDKAWLNMFFIMEMQLQGTVKHQL